MGNASLSESTVEAVALDWLAVNQFTVVENRHERRPDIVLFVNSSLSPVDPGRR